MDSFENYDLIRDLVDGNGGRVTRLMWYKPTSKLVAVKFIPYGDRVDQLVLREIVNHRSLRHPNVILLRRGFLTRPTLAIVMHFALVCRAPRPPLLRPPLPRRPAPASSSTSFIADVFLKRKTSVKKMPRPLAPPSSESVQNLALSGEAKRSSSSSAVEGLPTSESTTDLQKSTTGLPDFTFLP
ncbi:uncharacterized protein A4U43_C07F16000 [Asparagus officinalis]|uniref:Protein kinase domain-containing protein n=1 Tax=Asparagus officinalis TaxID=4686 RepID=A0A5P1ECK9_ASPOF|nr:uncharacterized protein A4U43_C07F16000 [Asparagus officinalis]